MVVGLWLGTREGTALVGLDVGESVGTWLGVDDGDTVVGVDVGPSVGANVGTFDGIGVDLEGACVGSGVGVWVGTRDEVGSWTGTYGASSIVKFFPLLKTFSAPTKVWAHPPCDPG